MKSEPDQIALPLDWPQSAGDARLILSDANRAAFDHFRKWSMWPVRATILTGPRRSGRSLLARSFVERVGGRLIDPELMAELDDFDSGMIVLRTASGKQCHINNSRTAVYGHDQRVELLGTTGMVISGTSPE